MHNDKGWSPFQNALADAKIKCFKTLLFSVNRNLIYFCEFQEWIIYRLIIISVFKCFIIVWYNFLRDSILQKKTAFILINIPFEKSASCIYFNNSYIDKNPIQSKNKTEQMLKKIRTKADNISICIYEDVTGNTSLHSKLQLFKTEINITLKIFTTYKIL